MVELKDTRKPPNEVLADLVNEKLGNFREYIELYPQDFLIREPSFGDSLSSIYFFMENEELSARAFPAKKITFEKEHIIILYYTKYPQDRWWFKQIIKEILIGNSTATETDQWKDIGLHWLEVDDISYGVVFEGTGETVAYSVSVSISVNFQGNYFNLER